MRTLKDCIVVTASAARDRSGVTAAEYAILAVGIVIVVGAAVSILGDPLSGAMALAGSAMTSCQTALVNGPC